MANWLDLLKGNTSDGQFNSDLIDPNRAPSEPLVNPVLTGQKSQLIGDLMQGIPGADGYPITKQAEDSIKPELPPIPMRIDTSAADVPAPAPVSKMSMNRKSETLSGKGTPLTDNEIVPITESAPQASKAPVAPPVAPAAQAAPTGPDLSDPTLDAALAERKNMMLLQALIRSGNQVGNAIAGVKQNPNYLSEYDQIIQEPVASLKEKRGSEKEKKAEFRQGQQDVQAKEKFEMDKKQAEMQIAKATADMDNVKAMQDPNSDISRAMQDAKAQEFETYAKLTGLPINIDKIKGLSGKAITEAYGKSNMESVYSAYVRAQGEKESAKMRSEDNKIRREEMQMNREESRKATQDRYDTSQVERYTKMVNQSEPFKESERIIGATAKVRELAKDAAANGGQSLAMLGPAVAKGLAGEVGVLTDKDVTRYTQNPSAAGGMIDTLQKVKSGKLSEVSYDNLMRLSDIMEAKARENRTDAYKKSAMQLSRNSNIPYEKAYEMLDPNADVGQSVLAPGKKAAQAPKGTYSAAEETGISAVMAKNPKASREQVVAALKKQGKIK